MNCEVWLHDVLWQNQTEHCCYGETGKNPSVDPPAALLLPLSISCAARHQAFFHAGAGAAAVTPAPSHRTAAAMPQTAPPEPARSAAGPPVPTPSQTPPPFSSQGQTHAAAASTSRRGWEPQQPPAAGTRLPGRRAPGQQHHGEGSGAETPGFRRATEAAGAARRCHGRRRDARHDTQPPQLKDKPSCAARPRPPAPHAHPPARPLPPAPGSRVGAQPS